MRDVHDTEHSGDHRTMTAKTTDTLTVAEATKPIENLPDHLKQFIVDQRYDKYTPIDHAVWRYVMRQNFHFLKDHAHGSYTNGLKQAGISIEYIPRMEEMNVILSKIGWSAVTVDGLIPSSAFMEFQANRILMITGDIRQIDHIAYTPAPDIIHEAAGHAPILGDPEYAKYLEQFCGVGAKALTNRKDHELFEAIRHLSIVKEAPSSTPEEIEAAERDVLEKQGNMGEPSELNELSRLYWWTVEYGLIGDLEKPKIYGAGLLSSVGESASCLQPGVKKIPYTVEAAEYAYDITKPQPQLFVTPDFAHLSKVLDEFTESMAFRVGGVEAVRKAIACKMTSTCELSSGLQISGTFSEVISDDQGGAAYLRTNSPTSLAHNNSQLKGHDKEYHADGFSSPVGLLRDRQTPLENLSESELAELGIRVGQDVRLQFASGVEVFGRLQGITRRDDKNLVLSFEPCTVTMGDQRLFEPEWGTYDMAVGTTVDSVYAGAADQDAFDPIDLVPGERTIKVDYDAKTRALHELYREVREIREQNLPVDSLEEIWQALQKNHPRDWLLSLEILEILTRRNADTSLIREIRDQLEDRAQKESELTKLIGDGLYLVDHPLPPL